MSKELDFNDPVVWDKAIQDLDKQSPKDMWAEKQHD